MDLSKLRSIMDARIWAAEWLKIIKKHPSMPMDEEDMTGWFANAIKAGYDNGEKKLSALDTRFGLSVIGPSMIKEKGFDDTGYMAGFIAGIKQARTYLKELSSED